MGYNITENIFTDIYGNELWRDNILLSRLFSVGQLFIEEFVEYKVKRVVVLGTAQIVNVEVID